MRVLINGRGEGQTQRRSVRKEARIAVMGVVEKERGPEPRNANGLGKMGKTKKPFPPQASRRNTGLPTP